MSVAEYGLYALARLFSDTNVAQDDEDRHAFDSREVHAAFRRRDYERILEAANRYGVSWRGRKLVDLGCHEGAITHCYSDAAHVIGLDVHPDSIELAQTTATSQVEFQLSGRTFLPLSDDSVDCIVSYDVFEHVADVPAILAECHRVLRPGGQMLIGTWGWKHPFACHLWSVMPVPWAHCLVSERTLMAACRRVFRSSWYRPRGNERDADGGIIQNKYSYDSISTEFLNKYLISDFCRAFAGSGMTWRVHRQPFGSRWARWSGPLIKVPWLGEYVTAYIWCVLKKPDALETQSNRSAATV